MARLTKYSSQITQPKVRGGAQAMLYATGMTEPDMEKPQVGVASVWYDGNPCNMHLLDLAAEVKKGVEATGGVGMGFNTIGVSDGISMGTDGMSFSLQSRDLIADSIETVMSAHYYDALVTLPGCDKNMPGCLMATCRLNRPALCIYGGTIKAGCAAGIEGKLDIVSAVESYGAYLSGAIDEETRRKIVRNSCPGAGACGGMYTANTMSSAIEAMGMSLPYSASIPAEDHAKLEECRQAGAAIRVLLEKDIKPRDIVTRESLLNALTVIMAVGGSTNSVLHMIAIARSAGVALTIDDFQAVSNRTPLLADLRPSGKYVQEDLHSVGGIPAVMKLLLAEGLIDGACLTCTGKTVAENLADLPDLKTGQQIIRPIGDPIKSSGHLQILRGNVAPEGGVAKITGKEGEVFSGLAKVFDCEEEMIAAVERDEIGPGTVVVIRYEGPQGGPGMPEMLAPTAAIMATGHGKDVALITDGRFSGGSHGFIVGHVTPEAQLGGPIGLLQDGDEITIDAVNNQLDVDLTDDELASRRATWTAPPFKAARGTLHKYIKNVKPASEGCVTDE